MPALTTGEALLLHRTVPGAHIFQSQRWMKLNVWHLILVALLPGIELLYQVVKEPGVDLDDLQKNPYQKLNQSALTIHSIA
jgi:hypothetical protein